MPYMSKFELRYFRHAIAIHRNSLCFSNGVFSDGVIRIKIVIVIFL